MLISNIHLFRKLHTGFRLVHSWWPWMTLNGIVANITLHFKPNYIKLGEARHILSSVQTWPKVWSFWQHTIYGDICIDDRGHMC